MKIFICGVCGHIAFEAAPDNCPVCYAPKEKFAQNDNVFKDSQENSPEAEAKHMPAVKVNKECGLIPEDSCIDAIVRIGETLHPMVAEHFIQFIDCYIDNDFVSRVHLTPGVNPATCFHFKKEGKELTIVEKCNKHGYWLKTSEL